MIKIKKVADAATTIPRLKVCGIDVILNEDNYYIENQFLVYVVHASISVGGKTT